MQNLEQLDIHVFDTVPDNLIDQVDKLLEENGSNNRVNGETSSNKWSIERFVNKKDRYKYIVALIDNAVVGIILLFKRNVDYHGKPIVVGGLGGVGVQEKYRGKGIASRMLTIAKETLDSSDCDIAFLGTDVEDPQMLKMYGRIGFVPLKKAFTYTGRSGEQYEDAESGMIASIHSPELFNEILKDPDMFNIGIGTW